MFCGTTPIRVVCIKVEAIIRQPHTLNWKFPRNGGHGNIEMATPWDELHNSPDEENDPPQRTTTPNVRLNGRKTGGIKATCCKTECIVHSIITGVFCWSRLECNEKFVYFVVYLQTLCLLNCVPCYYNGIKIHLLGRNGGFELNK